MNTNSSDRADEHSKHSFKSDSSFQLPSISSLNEDKSSFQTNDDFKEDKQEIEDSASSMTDFDDGDQHLESAQVSEMAKEFLSRLDRKMIDNICFEDKLLLMSGDGKTVGDYVANIEWTTSTDQDMLFVRAATHGMFDGIPGSTSLTAFIDPTSLMVSQQEYREVLKLPEGNHEKRTVLSRCDTTGDLKLQRINTINNKYTKRLVVFEKDKLHGLVTEASNIVLLRLLITSGYPLNDVGFISIDSEAKRLVPTSYSSLPPKKQKIGKNILDVKGIERKLFVEDLSTFWQYYFTEDAILCHRTQVGCPVSFVIDKFPLSISSQCIFQPKPLFEKQALDWENDLELSSNHIQRREEIKSSHSSYFHKHPEIKSLLNDFLLFALFRRPENIYEFTANFFSSFDDPNSFNDSMEIPYISENKTNTFLNFPI